MTIIVVSANGMVADSVLIAGYRREELVFPKIIRCADGSLAGAAGRNQDCWSFTDWARRGFPDDWEMPSVDEDTFLGVRLMPDGQCRAYSSQKKWQPVALPYVIGTETACNIAWGALRMGATPQAAVEVAIELCISVGGNIQVEELIEIPF